VIYLLTRPIAWVFSLLMWIVKRPAALVRGSRNRRMRRDVKELKKAQRP
jgi:hypothetical protein